MLCPPVVKRLERKRPLIFRTYTVVIQVFGVVTLFLSDVHPAARIPRIGVLLVPPARSALEAFRQGLRDLGYIEGKNIVIEYRFAKGEQERVLAVAADLIEKKVDLILTAGTAQAHAIQRVTTTIPIVVAVSGDLVGAGLAASLARPGGNITGLSMRSPEVSGKRLELLKEAVPNSSRVGILWDGLVPENTLDFRNTQAVARAMGLEVESLQVRGPQDLNSAFSLAVRHRVNALVVIGGGVVNTERKRVLAFELRNRLPAMHEPLLFAESGGLMAYGVSLPDLYRRSAAYVDKILKGTKPADLPVQQTTKFELIINLKTAKQIDLTIPPEVLARADKVIK
jgi:putative ABC transport system substrate-binding protein